MGRNPKTGEEVPISARRVVVFRPAQKLKHQVNHSEGPLIAKNGHLLDFRGSRDGQMLLLHRSFRHCFYKLVNLFANFGVFDGCVVADKFKRFALF